ncbi:hypothetical protein LXL04_000026 [Taraxacum kok-saghyz]
MAEKLDQTPANQTQRKPVIPAYVKAMSGSLGGIVEASCLQPIDVIKTRLQLDRSGHYKGILHCGSTTVTNEGVRALWKGLTPFATHLTLKYALRMCSNAVIQSAFKDAKTCKISDGGRFVSGFGAGVIEALVIVTPFEVVKIRLQQQKGLTRRASKVQRSSARLIIREEGLLEETRRRWKSPTPMAVDDIRVPSRARGSSISGFLSGLAGRRRSGRKREVASTSEWPETGSRSRRRSGRKQEVLVAGMWKREKTSRSRREGMLNNPGLGYLNVGPRRN